MPAQERYTYPVIHYRKNMISTTHISQKTLLVTFALVLGVLFVLAAPTPSEAATGSSESSTATSTKGMNKKVNLTCMATAIDTREDAVMTAWKNFSSTTIAALGVRKTALHTAWGMTEMKARTAAVVKAWKEWRSASMKAHKALRGERKAAWDAFKKTAKDTCKMPTPKEESQDVAAKDTIAL